MSFDLKLTWPDENESLTLKFSQERLQSAGQHGQLTVLETQSGEKYLLKIFNRAIDLDNKTIPFADIDLDASPEEMKDRLQLWRAINEYTASNLAQDLELNVPESLIITSRVISDFPLEFSDVLPLPADEIILDEELGSPETAEEFYLLSLRENYIISTSDAFESLLASQSLEKDPTTVIGILTQLVPNTKTIDKYLENEIAFEKAVEKISSIDNAYKLIPFDTWLNDPDRNQGNYLVQFSEDGETPIDLWGIDYEMWSFSYDDLLTIGDEEDITHGRSYLTAIIHKTTDFFDKRVLETFFKISCMKDDDIDVLSYVPKLLCQFIEYHIKNNHLENDERFKLLQIEENIRDFLFESIPKIDKLSIRLINQIGLPTDLKELEDDILNIDEDEFFKQDYFSGLHEDDDDWDDMEYEDNDEDEDDDDEDDNDEDADDEDEDDDDDEDEDEDEDKDE